MAYLDVTSLADAKLYLRIDDTLTDDDNQIEQMINTAWRHIERVTNVLVYDRDKTYRFVDGAVRVYDYPINSVIDPPANVYATGTAQCTSVVATNNLVVNGLTYTAIAGTPTSDAEFSVDGTDTVVARSLARAINSDSRTGTLADVSASSTGDTVTITTTKKGYAGNATTLAETGGTITLSGATFTGGLDGDMSDIETYTLFTNYCYGTGNSDLILNVGYTDPDDVPDDLKLVAEEIIDILYYGKETGKTMADLSPMSMDILNSNKRFIL